MYLIYCYNTPVLYSDENGMMAYGSDSNFTLINNVAGYIRSDGPVNGIMRSQYIKSGEYAHFNCYLYIEYSNNWNGSFRKI